MDTIRVKEFYRHIKIISFNIKSIIWNIQITSFKELHKHKTKGFNTTSIRLCLGDEEWVGEGLTWVDAVVKVFPVVKPDLSKPGVVVVDHLAGATREAVRGGLAEYMSDVGARSDLKDAPAHPDLLHAHNTIHYLTFLRNTGRGSCRKVL